MLCALFVDGLNLLAGRWIGQRVEAELRRARHLAFIDLKSLQHLEWVLVHLHHQPPKCAPCAAHGVKSPPGVLHYLTGLQRVPHALAKFLGIIDNIPKGQRPQHKAFAGLRTFLQADALQLQARAAQIADQAGGIVNAEIHPARGKPRFILPAQQADGTAQHLAGLFEKRVPITCHPNGCCSDGLIGLHIQCTEYRPVAAQRLQRRLNTLGGKMPRLRHTLTKARHDLFVEGLENGRPHHLADHEAHRVRPDVDDACKPGPRKTHLGCISR